MQLLTAMVTITMATLFVWNVRGALVAGVVATEVVAVVMVVAVAVVMVVAVAMGVVVAMGVEEVTEALDVMIEDRVAAGTVHSRVDDLTTESQSPVTDCATHSSVITSLLLSHQSHKLT